jgi:hypothetical protein
MVEAAGVEPLTGVLSNLLMARDFFPKGLIIQPLPSIFEFTRLRFSPLQNAPVVEK